jgi:hypothetical protein
VSDKEVVVGFIFEFRGEGFYLHSFGEVDDPHMRPQTEGLSVFGFVEFLPEEVTEVDVESVDEASPEVHKDTFEFFDVGEGIVNFIEGTVGFDFFEDESRFKDGCNFVIEF